MNKYKVFLDIISDYSDITNANQLYCNLYINHYVHDNAHLFVDDNIDIETEHIILC